MNIKDEQTDITSGRKPLSTVKIGRGLKFSGKRSNFESIFGSTLEQVSEQCSEFKACGLL